MKNVTVSLDDETHRRARVKAAEAGRSLSSLVRDYLNDLSADVSEFERLKLEEHRLRETKTGFRSPPIVDRETLHNRWL